MDNPMIATLVGSFLSIVDLVSLGSTCKLLEQVGKGVIIVTLRTWSNKIRLLQEIEEAAEKVERARWEGAFLQEEETQEGRTNVSEDVAANERRQENNTAIELCNTESDDEERSYESEESLLFLLLKYEIYVMALTKSGKDLNFYFDLKEASQGGPIKVTGLHLAALYDDVDLCRLLIDRGANFQPNICIPNDQQSNDRSIEASNKMDGSDWSQYTWGYITPRRLANILGNHNVEEFLSKHEEIVCSQTSGGSPPGIIIDRIARPKVAIMQRYTIGSVFAKQGNPGFPNIRQCDCWISETGDAIFYINTYMHGDRVYPDILFRRGDDPMSESWYE